MYCLSLNRDEIGRFEVTEDALWCTGTATIRHTALQPFASPSAPARNTL